MNDLLNSLLENPAYLAAAAFLFPMGLRLIAFASSSKTSIFYGLVTLPKGRSKRAKKNRLFVSLFGFGLMLLGVYFVYLSTVPEKLNPKKHTSSPEKKPTQTRNSVKAVFDELTILPYPCQPTELKLDYHVLLEGVYDEKEAAEQKAMALSSLGMSKAKCRYFNCPDHIEYHGKYVVTVERFCRSLQSLSEKKRECEAIARNNGIEIEFQPKKITYLD